MQGNTLSRWLAAALLAASQVAFAQTKEVTFAYQDMLVPFRTVIDSGELEKTTGYKINWRQFGGGGDVIRAMSSGDVQLGEAGSSPIAAAAISCGRRLTMLTSRGLMPVCFRPTSNW